MKILASAKRALCILLSAALLLAAPGIGPYQAAAQTAPTPVRVVTPVGGLNLGAVGGALGAGNNLQNTRMPASLPGFTGSVNSLVAPMDLPTPLIETNAGRAAAPAALSLPLSAIANPSAPQTLPRLRPSGGGMQPAAFQAPAFFRERALSSEASASEAALADKVVASDAAKAEPDVRAEVGEVAALKDGEALQTLRGKSNNLSQRFEELRRFFSESKDAAGLRADGRALDEARGGDGSARSAETSAVDAARGWLSRIPFLGRRVIQTPEAETGLALSFDAQADKAGATPTALSLKSGPVFKPSLAPAETSEESPLALPASAIPGSKNLQAAPASASEGRLSQPGQEKRSALGKVAWWFIGSLLVAQVGVEALGSSMPTLVQKAFGDFTVVAQLAVFSSIAGIIGRQIGPVIVDKFGIKTAYVGSMLARLVSISALIGLLATGHITLPLMIGFYSVNALLNGVTLTAMNSIPPLLVGQTNSALERFWSVQHTLVEIIGIAGPIATGIVVSSFGFIPALIAFPVASLASALIVWKTLRLPPESELKGPVSQAQAPAGVGGVFKAFFQKIGRGAKLVWNDPALRTSFILYSLVMMLNPFLYQMVAPGFALRLIGEAAPELATSVGGWLTGFYSLGGLLGALLMTMEGNKIAKGKAEGRIDDEQEKQILRKSLLRWLLIGTGGLALLGTFAISLPTLGTLVALPSFLAWASGLTLPALALIPFGIAQVISTLKLQSFFQARVPRKEDMADAMGFLGSASLAITTVGIVGLKYLFKAALGMTPFVYISAALIPLALAYLYLRWKLSKV
ncbi:MAG TPA: hypothetical protein DCM05_11800 [Elusimicrobia bacterium]|nr:hypothetical protein [Elusimicrobiota bacterium]